MLSLTKENQYYQILLSQGFGVGIGIGMIYVPSVAILSHYFRRRRNLVMTIVAAGSSLGAVVHPIMLNNTIPKIGFAKATRANAGLVSGLLLVSCLIMRTRLPPPSSTPDLRKSLIKFSKDKAYICCTLGYDYLILLSQSTKSAFWQVLLLYHWILLPYILSPVRLHISSSEPKFCFLLSKRPLHNFSIDVNCHSARDYERIILYGTNLRWLYRRSHWNRKSCSDIYSNLQHSDFLHDCNLECGKRGGDRYNLRFLIRRM